MQSDSTNTEVDLQTAMIVGLESLEPPPPKNVTFYNSTINLGRLSFLLCAIANSLLLLLMLLLVVVKYCCYYCHHRYYIHYRC